MLGLKPPAATSFALEDGKYATWEIYTIRWSSAGCLHDHPWRKTSWFPTEKRRALQVWPIRGSHHTVELQGSHLGGRARWLYIKHMCKSQYYCNITCIHYQTYPSLIFSFLHNSLTWHHFCFRRNSTKKYMNRNCTARITSSCGKRGVVTRNLKPVRPFSEF